MKKLSLTARELLTDGSLGLGFLIAGIICTFRPVSLPALIVLDIAVVIEVLGIIFRFKGKYDVWDELAKAHYAKARKITLNTIMLILRIAIILWLFLALFEIDFSFEFTVWHLMIVCGFIQILTPIIFAVIEKRDS